MKRMLKKVTQKVTKTKNNSPDHLWEIIKIPLFILILFSIFTSFIPSTAYASQKNMISMLSVLVSVGAFGYIGYRAVKIKQETRFALKAGAYAGVIIGFVGAVLGLIIVYFFPDKLVSTISEVVSSSKLDYAFVKKLMVISSWTNLVLGPVFNGLIGALISWLSALIFKKR